MKRASWDTIDDHYEEHYPGPHYNASMRNAFRAGWQDCENQPPHERYCGCEECHEILEHYCTHYFIEGYCVVCHMEDN